ncbi:MAG: hypothetical protein MJB14_14480 [Spirochaetes bacterium]|nr:hypothetical protein [Spirochaetota bacterium]
MKKKRYLGEILIDFNFITPEKLEEVLQLQKARQEEHLLLGEILIRDKIINQQQLEKALKITLQDVIDDENTDKLIREAAELSLKKINHNLEETPDNKLTEEGRAILVIRLKDYQSQKDDLKKSIIKNKQLKITKFRNIMIHNSKAKMIELEKKIQMLERDLNFFG